VLTVAIFAALYAAHDLIIVPLNRHIAWITGAILGAHAVNFARVLSLIALGIFARDWFEIAHFYAWQVVFFATIVACWFGCILRIPPRA
jgi:exosortase/archaeosortase family protein